MKKVCVVATAVALVLGLAPAVRADPFVKPPETSSLIPPGGWASAFPYPRNVAIDFATDPAGWPADPGGTGKDLQPGVNYHLQGWDDAALYASDWFDWSGDLFWFDQDPTGTSGRQGLFGVYDQENPTQEFTWHLDNSVRPDPMKHIWLEAEYYSNKYAEWYIVPSAPGAVFHDFKWEAVALTDNWIRLNIWIEFLPNPPSENLTFRFYGNESISGTVLFDFVHVATECTPEPATLAFVSLGAVGLLARRRRK
jgi:hypothetical protein